ncbi:hypothetical protein Jolie1_058 [Mycobacterium phage Julie1]|uniref:Uncharacterized protein n=1 Tax=Mycobacterium phage Julie1 TaxID=1463812 RepID=W8EK03_9CAUD|nr:hypothetical protein CG90_gp58 [Mycobacterium phage Julie1]YP_009032282.1 hypothetical protein FH38_gp56 [Mycobacterium phage Hosp]AHJ88558.1 hypothetical protein Jolie1_058 [Mycobacterium phage Julie1]AHK12010.1 hypothetical protein Hosp_056 [Mycobacterium phage Hosp]
MRPSTIRAFAAGVVTGATLVLGVAWGAGVAEAAPIQEDDPAWDCRVNGDQVCGPGNSNGVAPGLYEAGQLRSPWPTISECAAPFLAPWDTTCTVRYVDPKHVNLGGR